MARTMASPQDALALTGDLSLVWALPGHGVAADTCGTRGFWGHDAPGGGRHYRSAIRRCGRFSCPVCSLESGGWASRESETIARRIRAGCARARSRAIHVIISPPPEKWAVDSYRSYTRLRHAVYRAATDAGFRGGCAVFHDRRLGSPRFNRGRPLGCREGPHWHLLGDGWIVPVCDLCALWNRREALPECPDCLEPPSTHLHGRDAFLKHGRWCGWVIKNLGVRKSVKATAFYLLSHASQATLPTGGILPTPEVGGGEPAWNPPHVVTWFGSMAYNKLKVPLIRGETIRCEVCDEDIPLKGWFELVWEGSGPPPEDDAGECEEGEWRRTSTRWEEP